MMIFFLIVLVAVLYVLALQCRTGHPKLEQLRGWYYAHRGLHGNGIPENSMAAFRRALEKGYGIELDIHLLKDGNLAVIHDASLKRTTGKDGFIEDLTTPELADYHLEGTDETIPQFSQVVALFAGKAPLIVELKPERGNHAALAEAACKLLDGYSGPYCIESFDPRCLQWLRKNRPQIVRGQLSQDFFEDKNVKLNPITKFVTTNLLMNFLTMPDFVAYNFKHRNVLAPWICKRLWRVQSVSWTLRSKEDFDLAVKEGALPIFEQFEP